VSRPYDGVCCQSPQIDARAQTVPRCWALPFLGPVQRSAERPTLQSGHAPTRSRYQAPVGRALLRSGSAGPQTRAKYKCG
jgi:hypothetical protein